MVAMTNYFKKFIALVVWVAENRRLKAYLYTIFKFFVITYLQSREILSEELREVRVFYVLSTAAGFMWMAVLGVIFTERYVREVYSVRKKVPLNITFNRVELSVYIVYVIYSFFTAILHIISIREELNHKYAEQPKLEITKPKGFALFYEVLEVLIHLYIIVEKLTHFMHANHSVSLYLESPKPVPNSKSKGFRIIESDSDDDAGMNRNSSDEQDASDKDYQLMEASAMSSSASMRASRRLSTHAGDTSSRSTLAE